MSYETFKDYMNRYLVELAESPATWEATAMNWAKAQGLIQGDDKGRDMPKKFVTRGELATMLARQAGVKV